MNAEEFRATLEKMDRAIKGISGRAINSRAAEHDLRTLTHLWYELDHHRWTMEEAEAKRKCDKCGVVMTIYGEDALVCPPCLTLSHHGRLYAIEKRLGEIEGRIGKNARGIDTVAGGYTNHMETLHNVRVDLTMLAVPGYETTCVPPAGG